MSDLHFGVLGKEKKIINNLKIRLDVMKERHALLLETNNLVKGNKGLLENKLIFLMKMRHSAFLFKINFLKNNYMAI